MAATLKTVTNQSQQVIPILVNKIDQKNKNSESDIPADKSYQIPLPPGSQLKVESPRLDNAQLEQLQNMKLIVVQ